MCVVQGTRYVHHLLAERWVSYAVHQRVQRAMYGVRIVLWSAAGGVTCFIPTAVPDVLTRESAHLPVGRCHYPGPAGFSTPELACPELLGGGSLQD